MAERHIQVTGSVEHAPIPAIGVSNTTVPRGLDPSDLATTLHRLTSSCRVSSIDSPNATLEPERTSASDIPSSSASIPPPITASVGQAKTPSPTFPPPTDVQPGLYITELGSNTASRPVIHPREEENPVYLAAAPPTFMNRMRFECRKKLDLTPMETPILESPARNAIAVRSELEVLSKGWVQYVHPEGNQYFRYYDELCHTHVLGRTSIRIEKAVTLIKEELMKQLVSPEDMEIGLELSVDEDRDTLGCYYIVNARKETIFWIHPISASLVTETDAVEILGKEHLAYVIAANYWCGSLFLRTHLYMFPHDRILSMEKVEVPKSNLDLYLIDKRTSRTSTASYGVEDMRDMIQTLDRIVINHAPSRPQHVAVVGPFAYELNEIVLIMWYGDRTRFYEYHGEHCARLDSEMSAHQETHRDRQIWFRVLSGVFFFAPQLYYNWLLKSWVDSRVNIERWTLLNQELQVDWSAGFTAVTTQSTVILTADVGFLAIQSVDQDCSGAPT
ncbi:hypothetical protein BD311DRAFT_742547 [Dichomitus squalens]|uniref:Uncharacterized protein n=1 Tax=Dichomitus squalens TaxID=114155 RepID=A0A4Q9M837_9APHY|nr:hypothetical protein BD311DRAFT_742547 [Dichomitus squalens]